MLLLPSSTNLKRSSKNKTVKYAFGAVPLALAASGAVLPTNNGSVLKLEDIGVVLAHKNKKPPALLLTNGFFYFYLLILDTVAGHKTLQRLTPQHPHGQKTAPAQAATPATAKISTRAQYRLSLNFDDPIF